MSNSARTGSRAEAWNLHRSLDAWRLQRGKKGIWTIPRNVLQQLHDPRGEPNRKPVLEEILVIAVEAVLSGAASWNEIPDKARRSSAIGPGGQAGEEFFLLPGSDAGGGKKSNAAHGAGSPCRIHRYPY
jgi:hypothetical protein